MGTSYSNINDIEKNITDKNIVLKELTETLNYKSFYEYNQIQITNIRFGKDIVYNGDKLDLIKKLFYFDCSKENGKSNDIFKKYDEDKIYVNFIFKRYFVLIIFSQNAIDDCCKSPPPYH